MSAEMGGAGEKRGSRAGLRHAASAALPSLALIGIFVLGFLGEPENDPWLTRSPLWGPGDPFYTDDPAQANHLAHPYLIWRGRPHHSGSYLYEAAGARNDFANNAFGLRDDEVAMPKPPGSVRVLNLGDSATWGLNLPGRSETYSDQLETRLASDAGEGARYEVINAGTVGYSSLQGVQFLRHWIAALEPDVVTIYLGNNDSSPSGMKDAERVAATSVPLHRWLSRNRFYLLLQKGILTLRAAFFAGDRDAFQRDLQLRDRESERSREDYYRLLARVTPEQYEANLRAMVRIGREAGARVILLAVPVNLVWPQDVRPFPPQILHADGFWGAVKVDPGYLERARRGQAPRGRALPGHPYLSLVDEAGLVAARAESPAQLRELRRAASPRDVVRASHDLAVWRVARGDWAAAERLLERARRDAEACGGCLRPREQARLSHTWGIVQLLRGRGEEAFAALRESRRTWPVAMSPDYAERFERVVRDLDVEWIDLPALFAAADPRFRGSALIHDWVHPNAAGNRVIAEALGGRITEGRSPGEKRAG